MRDQLSYFFKKHIIPTLLYVGFLYGWIDFLGKPFVRWADTQTSFSEGFIDLFRLYPAAFGGWPLLGYFWLFATFLLLIATIVFLLRPIRWLLTYLEVAEAPLSVLESSITMDFNDDWSRCEIRRVQLLHANKPGLNAYAYELYAHRGTVSIKSITSTIDSQKVTCETHRSNSEKKLSCVEQFEKPLPFSFFATYLPDAMVRWMYNNDMFQKSILKRVIVTIDADEYDGENPHFDLIARNKVSRTSILLKFPEKHAPKSAVRAHIIEESAMKPVPVVDEYRDGKTEYTVRQSSLKPNQVLRISWSAKAASSDVQPLPIPSGAQQTALL